MVLTAPTGCSATGGLQQGKMLASLISDGKPRKKKEKDQRTYAAASGTLLRFAVLLGFDPAFLKILVFLAAGAGFAEGPDAAARLRAAVSVGAPGSPEEGCWRICSSAHRI